jgi:hypothetical protein
MVDLSKLPERFAPLLPLIKIWGVTDDTERDELRAASSSTELERIVEKVQPYFEAINLYLDSFGDLPMSEAAIALGALAEFAAETQVLLMRPC